MQHLVCHDKMSQMGRVEGPTEERVRTHTEHIAAAVAAAIGGER